MPERSRCIHVDLQRHLGKRPYLLTDHPDAGFNQRMTDIQASLGTAQMDRASDIVSGDIGRYTMMHFQILNA